MRRVVVILFTVVFVVVAMLAGGTAYMLRRVPGTPAILVQLADGNLALVDEKGLTRALTTDADSRIRAYDFPVPAPDGGSVAYVETVRDGDGVRSSLIMQPFRGSATTLFASTDVAPFYLYWSPDSSQLAFLGGATDGMVLQNVNTRGTPQVQRVTPGQPSYFSWRPDSQQLLLHTSGAAPRGTIAVWNVNDTEPRLLDAAPALFNAPCWIDDGKAALVVVQDERGVGLVRLDADGAVDRRLADGGSGMLFGAAPDGSAVAYTRLDGPNVGPLRLVNADGTNDRALSSAATFGFVWSPDSTRIAYLTIPTAQETRPVAFKQEDGLRLTWNVVDVATGRSRALHTFEPSRAFLNLLPYFDQYAQSIRLWDRAGERLLFADTSGVWTLEATTGKVARVDDGVLGMWIAR